jgi:hypothetical protein
MASLLGSHSARIILATGTPYNNSMQDMASLCGYYDAAPRNRQNDAAWWDRAYNQQLTEGDKRIISAQLRTWRKNHFLRRTQSILDEQLPARIADREVCVVPSGAELEAGYLESEGMMVNAFQLFGQLLQSRGTGDAQARFVLEKRLKKMHELLMALMQKARMQMLHPVLACQGREVRRGRVRHSVPISTERSQRCTRS